MPADVGAVEAREPPWGEGRPRGGWVHGPKPGLALPRAYPRPRCSGSRFWRPPPVPLDTEGYDDADDDECHETRPYERMMQTPDQVADQSSTRTGEKPPVVTLRLAAGLPLGVLLVKMPGGLVSVGQKYRRGHCAASSCSTVPAGCAALPVRLGSARKARRFGYRRGRPGAANRYWCRRYRPRRPTDGVGAGATERTERQQGRKSWPRSHRGGLSRAGAARFRTRSTRPGGNGFTSSQSAARSIAA